MNEREALQVVLDQVDYTAKNCGPTEAVAAVLSPQVIELARKALRENEPPPRQRVEVLPWEELIISSHGPYDGGLRVRVHGECRSGKSKLIKDIIAALKAHPSWKSRDFRFNRRGESQEPFIRKGGLDAG